ncbi:E3 ubiquitin-protein ligase TRIM33-like isoform X2 [Ruditapes philippinarum]|uniref:E3 ubiquitin-protein ligase TRIM33-like isoform X2 n=1 Tax=Ruditapes philippinarum TaxID=129788 RepID=UPI00295BA7F7|nr:E3 ubiquitin-protein ligase TRIM33-like isoform X2 [Ruditapes philippinarum]
MAEIPEKDVETDKKMDSSKCAKCKEELTVEKQAKLLHCLHSFCQACLENYSTSKSKNGSEESQKDANVDGSTNQMKSCAEVSSTDDSKTRCPECHVEYVAANVLPNPFIHTSKKVDARIEDGSPSDAEKFPVCTSCEDNQKASSFCVDCQEWLCDPCVVAHKRVKLTKDHSISNKVKPDEVKEGIVGDSKQRHVHCQTHKTEMLKLFCLTCETLTCRDCQLNDHKDHKYQYIEETIEQQKKLLMEGVAALKSRLKTNQEMAEKITQKEKDIKDQQVEVFKEVRKVADLITNELISWCKQLLNFLQGVCHGRIKDLTFKKKEVDTFAKRAKHTISFVESALQSGDDLSVLHTKSFMTKNIKTLQDQTINFQNTLLDLNIKYENDAKFLTKNVSKMGFINVNGKSYPQQSVAEPQKPAICTLNNLSKENFSQQIAELIHQQPHATREQYKNLPVDRKKQFLAQLMSNCGRQRPAGGQQQVNLQQQQQQLQQQAQIQNRMGQFNSDSGAVQDLYKVRPPQPVRQPGQFFQQNTFQTNLTSTSRHPLQQQPFRPGPSLATQNLQHWRGTRPPQPGYPNADIGFGVSSTQNWQDASYNSLQNLMSFSNGNIASSSTYLPQGSAGPNNSAVSSSLTRPNSNPNLIPGNKLPPGKFDIDPLNLRGGSAEPVRVKQEPKDRDFSSCQFSNRPPNQTTPKPPDHNPRLQSPSTSTNHHSPGHTPSPSHSDGGPGAAHRSSISPAMPDINIIDTDRNELLQGLVNPSGQRLNAYHLQPKHDPSDPSEDYCAVCHNGGDLLCCDKCPKVFHLQCHVPAISTNFSSNEVWTCTLCSADEELKIKSPIPKEYEVTSTGKRKAPNGLVDKEIKVCERILLELFCLEISTVFHEPVPKSVPNYHKIIKDPMDFGAIKCKLRRGHFAHYNSVEEFLSDIKLVFRNCFKYNSEKSDVYAVGKSVQNYFESLVKHFLPCYVDYLSRRTPSPVTTMESNGTDGQSRNKKRRSPAPDSTRDNNSPVHFS